MLLPLVFPIFLAHGGVLGDIQLAKGYDQGQPFDLQVIQVPVKDMEGSPVVLETEAAHAFMRMMKHAKRDGHVLKIRTQSTATWQRHLGGAPTSVACQ
jgi:hypothetical protein